ncbi:AAEL002835-PA, partial [Aedes aegypti]
GNGPSGISLSYMLAGNWPYWSADKIQRHPDELLRARLNYYDSQKSLVEHDLFSLADGLEGRSTNPVSLLLDSLQHPCADLGMDLPCMVEYKYHPEKEIDHLVLGRGPPGGSWHRMDPNLRTLSLAAWMSLPGLAFSEWEHSSSKNSNNNNNTTVENQNFLRQQNNSIAYEERNGKVNIKLCPPRRNLSLKRQLSKEVETRALISRVAQYYASYVDEMNLAKFDRLTNKQFTVVCKNLVMANGASDLANRLGVKGEGLEMPWVTYELPQLEHALEKIDDEARSQLKPVLIVGAGLSAADAVTICRSSGIPVIHVYRNRTAGLDKMLPGNVYPEYHEVHKMMKDSNRKYDLYTPLPEHTIADLTQTVSIIVQHLKTGEKRELEVSFCAILIGSRPDLRFIAGLTKGSSTMHHDPTKPIDCKSNPIDVDKYTNAVLRSPYKGLYAMGPLVGDNFVRFIPGGALSITSALHKLTEND